ncbi:hypothetical protein AMTR_s00204p00014180 [Amborella trichopoda]|uniref:Uncharacterized protein n=1 Tax=Amborella trichopoda TaxID=13333 RepID=W1P8Z7_AMBTC|nr:hypothetical protein AMTR_s00204p00014180 [Amborella trichopoda]
MLCNDCWIKTSTVGVLWFQKVYCSIAFIYRRSVENLSERRNALQERCGSATLLPECIHRVPERNVSCTAETRSRNAGANSSTTETNYHTAGALWLQKVYCRSECLYRRRALLYHWRDVFKRQTALTPEGLLPERVFRSSKRVVFVAEKREKRHVNIGILDFF